MIFTLNFHQVIELYEFLHAVEIEKKWVIPEHVFLEIQYYLKKLTSKDGNTSINYFCNACKEGECRRCLNFSTHVNKKIDFCNCEGAKHFD